MTDIPVRITQLNIYPVKACRGISLQHVELLQMGFRYDRRWMIVDTHNSFLTQRSHPALATVETSIDNDKVKLSTPSRGSVTFSALQEQRADISVSVWRSSVQSFAVSQDVDRWLSDLLEDDVRLVGIREDGSRRVDPRYGKEGDSVGFADGFPVLVTGEASLQELNKHLAGPVSMNRFRPNIVLDGGGPFEEEEWSLLESPGVAIRLVKKCARCTVTTVDQQTGVRGKEPLHTLARIHSDGNNAYFGMNGIPDRTGRLNVGDRLRAK